MVEKCFSLTRENLCIIWGWLGGKFALFTPTTKLGGNSDKSTKRAVETGNFRKILCLENLTRWDRRNKKQKFDSATKVGENFVIKIIIMPLSAASNKVGVEANEGASGGWHVYHIQNRVDCVYV